MSDYVAQPIQGANTTTAGDQFAPQVADLAGGGFVVAWTSGTGDQAAVYAQVFDAAGVKVGAETRLFFDPAVTGDGYYLGGVVGLADGSFVVSATSTHPDPAGVNPPLSTVYAQRVSSLGEPAAEPIVVTAELAFVGGYTLSAGAVHAAPNGGFYVEMDRLYNPTPQFGYGTYLQRYDANGTAIGMRFTVGTGDLSYPQVAVLASGAVASAWSVLHVQGLALTWQLTSSAGELIAQETIQGSAGTLESTPAIAALEDGNFIVAWHHAPSTLPDAPADPLPSGWVGQLRNEEGQSLGEPFALAIPPEASGVQLTAMPDGGFLARWSDGTGWVGRDFDAAGQPTGDIFAIGATVTDIAASLDGGFWVALQLANDGQDVYVQIFDDAPPGGTFAGGNGKDELHGTAGDDTLLGANGKDLLYGHLGNDLLDGGNGVDTAVYAGSRSEYIVTQTSSGYSVSGPEGTDTLVNVERLQFGDTALEDAQFITQLYANVLGRAPDEGGMQCHLDEIAHGHTRAGMLTHFSESPENLAAVIGSIQGGMMYSLA